MHDSAKYLIHADITANGVVERNDVVGAIFGQTEGLLGDDLDLRELQDHSKVGRIDVDVESESGQSFGEITIASGLDRVETALLAASLETIERVGPCRATIEVSDLEDVRSAKRRAVVDRATDLLAELEDESVTSVDIVDEVRQRVRVETITDYEGYPAGPRVEDSDAIVVVEGRSDVLQLLQYGVKNAIAVEGTDVPTPVADLTKQRTVTAFLDGDRGGKLILKELAQVGAVDYVAFAPPGTSVEDLSRGHITAALREKAPADTVLDASDPQSLVEADAEVDPDDTEPAGTDDAAVDRSAVGRSAVGRSTAERTESDGAEAAGAEAGQSDRADEPLSTAPDGHTTAVEMRSTGDSPATDASALGESATARERPGDETAAREATAGETAAGETPAGGAPVDSPAAVTETASPETESTETTDTVAGHAGAVIGGESGLVRLLDGESRTVTEGEADDAFDLVEGADTVPATVVVDGPVSQRLLDVAAQRGVEQVVGAGEGEFVKRPTSVRVRTIDDF